MIKETVLIVAILMPGQQPDVVHRTAMPTLQECLDRAKAFVDRDLTDDLRTHGAIGYSASCAWREAPSEKN
jgi:hypothetical protein